MVYLPTYVVHRDPSIWGPDASQFRPERWADAEYVKGLHPFAYLPFSKGPRNCIGQTFAMLEAKSVLAMLYQKFTFRYAGEEPEEIVYKFTTHPKFGVPVTVFRRSS